MTKYALIVDDAVDWGHMLAGVINDLYPEVDVTVVHSYEDAEQSLVEKQFDAAFIDIRLNDADEANTDGVRLMQMVHRECPDTKVFLVTGYPSLDTVKQSMHPDLLGERPVVDYLKKDKLHLELPNRLELIFGERSSGRIEHDSQRQNIGGR